MFQHRTYVAKAFEAFVGGLDSMEVSLSAKSISLVKEWLEFYVSWEGRRVVGFEDPEQMAIKLIVDSFSVAFLKDTVSFSKSMDLGSGNGWPGLALSLVEEGSNLWLLDSRQGACNFLNDFIQTYNIEGTKVIQGRAEELGRRPIFREKFSLVASRAMAEPAVALELSSGFLNIGGNAVLWLSSEQDPPKSGSGLDDLGLSFEKAHQYVLPKGMGSRTLAVYSKIAPCREKFPRRYPAIRNKPLY